MNCHLKHHREGFPLGQTQVTSAHDTEHNTGITFTILKLQPGESKTVHSSMELALLLMGGNLTINIDGTSTDATRRSLFDESPFAVHICANTSMKIHAIDDVEIALFETPNEKTFPYVIYHQELTANEWRGDGQVGDMCLRNVRTIFDNTNSHPNTELVLGEVINFPGRWSSYPPHHHPQPEIYHYRFDHQQGFGHGELGEDVLKIRPYDTVKILDEVDHAQCSAPGYAMYYIWVIRHLPNNRYTVPEFTEDHRWTMTAEADIWAPQREGALI